MPRTALIQNRRSAAWLLGNGRTIAKRSHNTPHLDSKIPCLASFLRADAAACFRRVRRMQMGELELHVHGCKPARHAPDGYV